MVPTMPYPGRRSQDARAPGGPETPGQGGARRLGSIPPWFASARRAHLRRPSFCSSARASSARRSRSRPRGSASRSSPSIAIADAPAMQVAHRSHVIAMTDRRDAPPRHPRRAARLRRARDRGDRHAHARRARGRGGHRHPDGARRPGSRWTARASGASRRRQLGPPDVALRLRVGPSTSIARRVAKRGAAVRGQADHELVGQGAERGRTSRDEAERAYTYAQEHGRTGGGKVIVEGLVDFDYEITMLTVRHAGGTSLCEPGRASPGARRLPRELAAAAHVRGGLARGRAHRACRHRRPRGPRHLRGRALREGRRRCSSARSRRARTTPGW